MKPALRLTLVCTLLMIASAATGAQTGHGPPISVANAAPSPNDHRLPPPNRIDQSRETARRKSAGCLECHAGLDAHAEAEPGRP